MHVTFASLLDARTRLMRRRIEPRRIEISERVEMSSSLFPILVPGVRLLGLEVVFGSGPGVSVSGKRRHGKYEVVAYEREPVETT